MRRAEKVEGRKCPYCGSTENQIKLGTTKAGSARHKCKICQKVYIPEKKNRGYSEETKRQAIRAFYSGLSGRKVGKLFNMSKANVYNWIKKNREGVDKS
jgi:transposase-like protein